ncbi:MAG: hypothetical protein EOO06_00340 [Chitinophagaceae bacterium]|nr:MAG: hypothetical protein EOO06_00340 [Chitinophagaceae bacterium]
MAFTSAIQKLDLRLLMETLGEQYVDELKKALLSQDKKASGNLIKSLKSKLIKKADSYSMVITGADYLKFVDGGRKPGGKLPPVKKIIKWAELRNIKINGKSSEQVGWMIAKSIQKKGIEPTNIIYEAGIKILDEVKNIKILNRIDPKELDRMLQQIVDELTNESTSIVTKTKK